MTMSQTITITSSHQLDIRDNVTAIAAMDTLSMNLSPAFRESHSPIFVMLKGKLLMSPVLH